jgi:hypothetical protein
LAVARNKQTVIAQGGKKFHQARSGGKK